MLESLTAIRRSRFVCISRVVILIIGLLLILGFQIILVIVSFLEFLLFISVKFIVGFNTAVNVMQSVTFKLNISTPSTVHKLILQLQTKLRGQLYSQMVTPLEAAVAMRLNVQRCMPLGV